MKDLRSLPRRQARVSRPKTELNEGWPESLLKQRKQTMNWHHISKPISTGTVKDLIAAHLYAIGMVNDDEDVDINFDKNSVFNTKDTIALSLIIKKRREVHTKE